MTLPSSLVSFYLSLSISLEFFWPLVPFVPLLLYLLDPFLLVVPIFPWLLFTYCITILLRSSFAIGLHPFVTGHITDSLGYIY